ncbi:hypothetical protein N7508_006963 [Penicillium antarcticum]|nr:hypothetical protein N7508_006963 [Penicillium antarcticum]
MEGIPFCIPPGFNFGPGFDPSLTQEKGNRSLSSPKCYLPALPTSTEKRKDSLVVTHLTTNLPACGLSTAERTGSPVLHTLWSYVLDTVVKEFMYHKIERYNCLCPNGIRIVTVTYSLRFRMHTYHNLMTTVSAQ